MFNNILILAVLVLVCTLLAETCLITNCPRGGKRAGKMGRSDVRPCVSCGPGRIGQCFGPGICCGPFGCLIGTPESMVCQREGYFHENEPCIAGNSSCRRNTGRCAAEGVCCNQDCTGSMCSCKRKQIPCIGSCKCMAQKTCANTSTSNFSNLPSLVILHVIVIVELGES